MWVTSAFYVHFLRRFALLVVIPILYDHLYLINMLVNNLKQTFVGICGFLPNSDNTPIPYGRAYVRDYTRYYTRIFSITKHHRDIHIMSRMCLCLSVGSFGAELSTDVVRRILDLHPRRMAWFLHDGPGSLPVGGFLQSVNQDEPDIRREEVTYRDIITLKYNWKEII